MMNISQKVSVIIPTYNRPKNLHRAISSCVKQTYDNIEIIVVDDCSKVNNEKVVDKIGSNRVRFFRNEENKGAPYSRNKGLSEAKGNYIMFLDDDDIILPTKIEEQIDYFETSKDKNLGVVTCDVRYKRPDINEVKRNRKKGWLYKDLLKAYCVYGTETMLIKKEHLQSIGGFDTSLESNQEYDLQIRLSKSCTYSYVPKVLAEKHTSQRQISFNFDKKLNGTKYLWHKYKNEFKKEKVYTYNYFRFTYLLFKYRIGKYLGKRIYSWMP